MAITSKVRCTYVWEYSGPLTVQSCVLFTLAAPEAVSAACSDEVVSESSNSSCRCDNFLCQATCVGVGIS